MILLSISPFIFIQCGSGGGIDLYRQEEKKRAGRRRRAAPQVFFSPAPSLYFSFFFFSLFFFLLGAPALFPFAPRFHTGKAHRGSAVRPFRSI